MQRLLHFAPAPLVVEVDSVMDKKVVLITGCSSGIGLSLAVRLASEPGKAYKGTVATTKGRGALDFPSIASVMCLLREQAETLCATCH